MKLRVRGNSLRFRLSQSETETIKNKGLIEETTVFPDNQAFSYCLLSDSESGDIKAEFAGGAIKIKIPASLIEKWAESDETGIYGESGAIKIAIEKDFKCLVERGEEDKDSFPHPKQGSLEC